jgi:methyltransferase family protein
VLNFIDPLIKPYIIESRYHNLCEIGASYGLSTDKFLEIDSVVITVIDPCLDLDLCEKYRDNKKIRVHRGASIDVLQKITETFDCIFIDGDHNWYTVYNELKTIDGKGLIREGGAIFFHDVCWPYGRRDMYYQPDLIPEEFRRPYRKGGIVRGQSELSGSLGINNHLYNAVYEGGARNGVLTAIEDFLKDNGDKYLFFCFEQEFGLGVLLRRTGGTGNDLFNRYMLYAEQLRHQTGSRK